MLSKHDGLTPYSIHVQRHKLAFLELFLPLAIHRSTLVLINHRWGIICQTEPLSASQPYPFMLRRNNTLCWDSIQSHELRTETSAFSRVPNSPKSPALR